MFAELLSHGQFVLLGDLRLQIGIPAEAEAIRGIGRAECLAAGQRDARARAE